MFLHYTLLHGKINIMRMCCIIKWKMQILFNRTACIRKYKLLNGKLLKGQLYED